VFKFLGWFLKNLGRNKLRTVLTAMAVLVLTAIYTIATSVTAVVNRLMTAYSNQSRLLVREKWVMPSRFPPRYVPKIAALPGVRDWTIWHFYMGSLDDAGHNGAGLATRIDNLREMHPGLETLDPAALEAMRRQKNGALMGRSLMKEMNWQIGQKFTVKSFSSFGRDLSFQVVGVVESDIWASNFFFRDDYYEEASGDKESVNILWLHATDEAAARRLSAEIEAMFATSRDKLRVETESAGVGRLLGRTASIVQIINFVVGVLLIDMIVVLSNSISMTVRERRREMAILKILGFQPGFILTMIVGEAMTVGMAGGALGAGLAYGLSALNSAGHLPVRVDFLGQFPVSPLYILHGLAVGGAVGFLGSVVPAWQARKVRVVEAFSNEG
jgi:putative ABC transport system permease protein